MDIDDDAYHDQAVEPCNESDIMVISWHQFKRRGKWIYPERKKTT